MFETLDICYSTYSVLGFGHACTIRLCKATGNYRYPVSWDTSHGITENDIELSGETIIRANGKLFKLETTVIKYIITFLCREDHLMVQIQTIENCKAKIFTQATTYARLVMNFFENSSWQKS